MLIHLVLHLLQKLLLLHNLLLKLLLTHLTLVGIAKRRQVTELHLLLLLRRLWLGERAAPNVVHRIRRLKLKHVRVGLGGLWCSHLLLLVDLTLLHRLHVEQSGERICLRLGLRGLLRHGCSLCRLHLGCCLERAERIKRLLLWLSGLGWLACNVHA